MNRIARVGIVPAGWTRARPFRAGPACAGLISVGRGSVERISAGLVCAGLVCLGLAYMSPPDALARPSFEKLVEEARELRTGGQFTESAARLGSAIALAHKKGDVEREREAARALDALLAPGDTVGTSSSAILLDDGQRAVLAAAMASLDASRRGAFVAGQVLARRLLLSATEHGDTEHATTCATTLGAAAKAKGSGRAPAILLSYAAGLTCRADGDAKGALSQFESVFGAAKAEGWDEVTALSGIEMARAHRDAGDSAAADAQVRTVCAVFEAGSSPTAAARLRRAFQAHFPDAPEELTKEITGAVSRATDGAAPITARSVNDPGFGKSKSTELGKAIKRFSAKKPLIEVTRNASGFGVQTHFDPKSEETRMFRHATQRVERGGLVLGLRGRAVAVLEFRTENEGASGIGGGVSRIRATNAGGTVAGPARAEYLLARGETFSLTKKGVVSIR